MRTVATSLLAISLLASTSRAQEPPVPKPVKNRVYVGTYNAGGKSKGIYQFEFDANTGEAAEPSLAAEAKDPSFLAIHPSREYLYAVDEIGDFEGKPSGAVSAFEIGETAGKLTLLNQKPTKGAAPCHLTIDGSGQYVLAANYGGGSVACLPIQSHGKLGDAVAFQQHKGSSVDKARQESPHAHSVNLDIGNRFAFVADLGLDKVMIYRFDFTSGSLTPHDPAFAEVEPGSGPRHFAFHPAGKSAYVINEMKSTITVFSYDAEAGKLKAIQNVSTLPADFVGESYTADVQVHPSGKFLYGSNRGHDSIAVFAIDPASGRLASLGREKTGGKTPRNFGIDPSGTYLLAENQGSDTIVVFKIDPFSGKLEPTGKSIAVPSPVCVKFLPME